MSMKSVPLVDAIVRPVAKRLARIEAILNEMRFENTIQLRRVNALQDQFDGYMEHEAKATATAKAIGKRARQSA